MNSGTQQRDFVISIAATKPEQALERARSIGDQWFRCQALSIAAVHVSDRRTRDRAIGEAFAAANDLQQPNRVVTVSSWPVKALTLTGNIARVPVEAARLLQIISTEGSPVRRADALRCLLGGVSAATNDVATRVATEFAAACLAPLQNGKRNKKGESLLEECLPGIARIERDFADRILGRLTPSRSERASRAMQEWQNVPLSMIFSWPNFGGVNGRG
jgi:hypothetical protein